MANPESQTSTPDQAPKPRKLMSPKLTFSNGGKVFEVPQPIPPPAETKKPAPATNEEPADTIQLREKPTQIRAGHQAAAPAGIEAHTATPATPSGTEEKATPDPLDPGPFPIDAMSPVARRIAEEVARCHQVPVEMTLLAVLGVLAASVPRNFTLKGGANGKVSHGNLYVLISAPRSAGKSSIAHPIVSPILERSSELLKDFREQIAPKLQAQLAVLEAREKQAVKKIEGLSKNDQCIEIHDTEETIKKLNPEIARLKADLKAEPLLWVGNHTSEKLSSVLAGNGEQCLIYATEGAEVFRVMAGKYSKDGRASYDIYLSGFSVETLNVARVSSGSLTITPCLSMIMFVQPVVLSEVLKNKEAAERGLFARLIAAEILVKPQPDDGVVREIDPTVQSDWNQLIGSLLNKREAERTLVCTPEARTVFTKYHNLTCDWRTGECSENEADLGRAREIAIRIALNLALADNPDTTEVTEDVARRAVAIGRWCLLTTYRLSNQTQAEVRKGRLQKLTTLLEESPSGWMTVRDLRRSHGFEEELLDKLVILSGGTLKKAAMKENGGRPSHVIRLTNPTQFSGT